MIERRTLSGIIFDFTNYIILCLLVISTLYPFIYVIFASFSSPTELAMHTGFLLHPLGFSTDAYSTVFKNSDIWVGYRNTLFYVIAGTAINILMTSLGAYVLTRKDFFWKSLILTMIIITMFFGGGMIPTFLLVKSLGMLDTPWALLVPGAISTWNLLIMRNSFSGIPDSLEESAKLDGANDWTILFKIILPLSLPIIAVMCLYYGVAHWNAWFNALIYLPNSRELFPLQLFLREILITSATNQMTIGIDQDKQTLAETIKYATIIVATMPILAAYPFVQKYFVKGVMVGAIKG